MNSRRATSRAPQPCGRAGGSSRMRDTRTKILLVEHDEREFSLIRSLLTGTTAHDQNFDVDWIHTFDDARDAIAGHRHDACLIDFDLGDHNGLDLLREVRGL